MPGIKLDSKVNFNFHTQVMCQKAGQNLNAISRIMQYLRLIYDDKKISFKDLLEKYRSVSIHHRNFRTLVVKLFKVFKGLSPIIFAEAFPVRRQYK